VAEALLDWGVKVIFGLPGDGINGFIEALRRRQDKIKFILVTAGCSFLLNLKPRKIF
jgi:pyruvate dehydrogenase (quinone)/pyruvate oxidase